MALHNTVQFRGRDTVLTAYENRNAPAWSLWVNKQFLFKYAGANCTEAHEQLEKHLEMLFSDGSTAIYTLKVYDEIHDTRLIKEKTESDGSFNFRLQDEPTRDNAISSRLAAIEKKLMDDKDDDDDDEDQGALGQITQALQNPMVAGLVKKIFGFELPGPVAISGVNDNQEDKTNQAIAILRTKDPQLGTHLMKLADIATKNIDNFKYIISLLEQVPL